MPIGQAIQREIPRKTAAPMRNGLASRKAMLDFKLEVPLIESCYRRSFCRCSYACGWQDGDLLAFDHARFDT